MNKKRIAAMLCVIMLTGCAGNNIDRNKDSDIKHNKEEKSGDISGEKTEEERGESDVPKEGTGSSVTETEPINKAAEEIPEETPPETEAEEVEISISKDPKQRLDMMKIFPEKEGTTYRYTGPIDYERIEKLGHSGYRKYFKGMYYEFQGYDNSDMESGKKRFYEKIYNVSEDGITLKIDEETMLLFDPKVAEREKSWTSDYVTNEWRKIQADFRALTWNKEMIQVEITPSDIEENVDIKGRRIIYTFKEGKGLDKIDIFYPLENGDEYAFPISSAKMTSEDIADIQSGRWPNIDAEFIEEDPVIKGYFDLSDSYFTGIQEVLEERISKESLTAENELEILQEAFAEMPDDSIKAVKYVSKIGKSAFEIAEDQYYLLVTIDEYKRRIKALDKIYLEEKIRFPQIDDAHIHWDKQDMSRYYYNFGHGVNWDRRLNIYLENFINPVEYDEYVLRPSEKFFSDLITDECPEKMVNYIIYSGLLDYKENQTDRDLKRNRQVESLIYLEELKSSGTTRYDDQIDSVFGCIIKPSLNNGKVKRLYIKALDNYINNSYNQEHIYIIDRIKAIIEAHGGNYSEELNEYLKDFIQMDNEDYLKYALNHVETNEHERELFERLEKNYVQLEEVNSQNEVQVWTGEEFLKALHDDAVIRVMDHMVIDSDGVDGIDEKIKAWDTITFDGVKNITIIGDGDSPIRVSVDSDYEVFKFLNCENIRIRNLSIGHVNYVCDGAVILAENTNGIKVEDSILYGCGTIGLDYSSVKDASVINSLIWDCRDIGIRFANVEGVHLNNLIVTENGKNELDIINCTDVEEINVVIGNVE